LVDIILASFLLLALTFIGLLLWRVLYLNQINKDLDKALADLEERHRKLVKEYSDAAKEVKILKKVDVVEHHTPLQPLKAIPAKAGRGRESISPL